jgi:hypothetical protein
MTVAPDFMMNPVISLKASVLPSVGTNAASGLPSTIRDTSETSSLPTSVEKLMNAAATTASTWRVRHPRCMALAARRPLSLR